MSDERDESDEKKSGGGYVGIDYSMGRSNRDPETGIHYGVIPLHRLGEYAYEDFEDEYGEPMCPQCEGPVVDYDCDKHGDEYSIEKHHSADLACETCKQILSSEYCYSDEPISRYYDDGKTKLSLDDSGDVWVLKSEWTAEVQFCSPCAPGAGYLLNEVEGGPRTYALGPEWFDEEQPMPYKATKIEAVEEIADGSSCMQCGFVASTVGERVTHEREKHNIDPDPIKKGGE